MRSTHEVSLVIRDANKQKALKPRATSTTTGRGDMLRCYCGRGSPARGVDRLSRERRQVVTTVSSRIVTVPNALSFFRLLLIPVFLVLLLTHEYLSALITLVVSSVTDFVDG